MIFTVVVVVWSVMMLRASGITLRLDGGFLFAVVLLFCLIVLACLTLLREMEKIRAAGGIYFLADSLFTVRNYDRIIRFIL